MITALITLYNPNQQVASNIRTIITQVDRVILCDNSSKRFESDILKLSNVIYLYFGRNLALSGAFNQALMNSSFGWSDDEYILFFDQDSYVEKGHVEGLINEYNSLREKYNIGCIGPLYYDRNADIIRIPKVKTQVNSNSYIVDSNITSSLLCQYGNLKKIGFWNEEIFLDMADWELCWRFINTGFVCFRTKKVLLSHTVGEGEKKIGVIHIRKGAPIRQYYQTRNYLYLLNKTYTPKRYKVRFIFNLFIRPVEHFIFLKSRLTRIRFVIAGYRDYFRKMHGEYGEGK